MKPDELPQSDTPDPADRDLSRRSAGGAISPWLIICLIALLGGLIYAVSAVI